MTRSFMIQVLKQRFPVNNPLSWSRCSTRQLKDWYEEYIEPNLTFTFEFEGDQDNWDRIMGKK